MPRNRQRKTEIGLHTEEQMRNALNMIVEGQTIRAVSKLTKIPFTTLQRYYKKLSNSLAQDPTSSISLTPNYAVRKIFTSTQEKAIADYIIKCSQMFYGLTTIDSRKLAYEMAMLNNIQVPQKWHDTKLAGVEWLYGFRKRHSILSLRTPEGCSLSRATSFNRHNVKLFFDNLENVMSREIVFGNGTRVFNLDETNTMTVQKSAKVLAVKGQKQVSKVTSAERGTLVTTCYIVSALGNTLPPVMIFPRVHFKQHMINEAPPGTLGLATQSGWINGELFVKTLQHFISHTNSCKNNPSLLILDNHESHICIEALNLAKENGVTIITVPPHSTGKMQPLDVGVFGPFKTAYNKAVDGWMMRNPGKTFSIYDVAGCVKEAHLKSMTPSNICNAFRATGIFPFNRDVFTDLDFAPSEVTDRQYEPNPVDIEQEINFCNDENDDKNRTRSPSPSILPPLQTPSAIEDDLILFTNCQNTPSNNIFLENCDQLPIQFLNDTQPEQSISSIAPQNQDLIQPPCTPVKLCHSVPDLNILSVNPSFASCCDQTPKPSTSGGLNTQTRTFISPLEFRGLPKAAPRKGGRTDRRKGKTMIATDTPEKAEIERRAEELKHKKAKVQIKAAVKRKVLDNNSSSEDDDRISIYSEEEPMLEEEAEVLTINPDKFIPLNSLPKEGDFVLILFEVKSKHIYYIARVIGEKDEETEVSFLRKSVKNPNKFHLPVIPDLATVPLHDIKMILPKPGFTGSTKRTQGLYYFDVDFSNIDLR